MSDTPNDGRKEPFRLNGDPAALAPLNSLISQAEISIEKAIETERSPASLNREFANFYRRADQELQVVLDSIDRHTQADPGGRIQCRAGCDHCCYRSPVASLPEVASVWNALAHLDPEALSAIRSRTAAYVQNISPFRPNHLGDSRVPCPLLFESRCAVYDSRPFSCRGLNSTDVKVCEQIKAGALPPNARPNWADLVYLTMAMRTGVRIGAFFSGIESGVVDLGLALGILFEHPDAIDQYLSGHNLFPEAKSDLNEENISLTGLVEANGPAFASSGELERPSGYLSGQEQREIKEDTIRYLETGDYSVFRAALEGPSVAKRLARIDVPRVAMSEDEIDASRAQFLHDLRNFAASEFSPAEAYNALSNHRTLNLPYQGRDDLDILTEHGQFIVAQVSSKALADLSSPPAEPRKPGKLRVGYLSVGLNRSNSGAWTLPWVRHHGADIETYCFLVGSRFDAITDQFQALSDHFFWLNRSVSQNATFIRSLDLDVLIYPEIGFYAPMAQYASLRLARTQCTAWGGPETSGLPTIDFYLSSEYMEPAEGDKHYLETLVRLPRTGLLLDPSRDGVPNRDRAYFGLPESEPVILMAQAGMKCVPKYDRVFARINERSGHPIYMLASDPPGDSNVLEERLRRAGVDVKWLPAMPGDDYVALLRVADVSIDPHMWSGGNTTVQALSQRTPVVTWPGPFMRSRHSLAFLMQAGVPGLIAKDEDDYVDLVCDFERQQAAMQSLEVDALYGDFGVVTALNEFLLNLRSS